MVYFGERRFRGDRDQRDKSNRRDKIQILLMVGLGALLGGVFIVEWNRRQHKPTVSADDKAPVEEFVDADAIPPPPSVDEPDAFVERPELIQATPDARLEATALPPYFAIVGEKSDAEMAALKYLFHRLRAGPPVENHGEMKLDLATVLETSDKLRGSRFKLIVNLLEDPQPRSLPDNPSGVRTYWEVHGYDQDSQLHRILFIDNSTPVRANEWVEFEADYFRICGDLDEEGRAARYPMWVANGFEVLPPTILATGSGDWNPVWWVCAFGLIGLVVMFVVVGPARPARVRRFKLDRMGSDAADSQR